MNRTVEIVQEWAGFEEKNPTGTIEDFCKDYLKKQQLKDITDNVDDCTPDYACRYALTRVINRLSRLWMFFTLTEMKPIGLTGFDEFVFLLTVQRLEPIRKKDLIYLHFIEISSGILIIDRLIKKGFLAEKTDEQDKRSKRVTITAKGKKVLADGHVALDHVYHDLYGDMPESAMLECLDQLNPLLDRIAKKWNQIKKFEPVSEAAQS